MVSAVYVFAGETAQVQDLIAEHQTDFEAAIITEVLPFEEFRLNTENYQKNENGAFCQTYIISKLKMLEQEYAAYFGKG